MSHRCPHNSRPWCPLSPGSQLAGQALTLACRFTLTTTCGIRTIIICIDVIRIRAKNVRELAQGHVSHERGGVTPDAFRYVECHALPRIGSERVLGEELGDLMRFIPSKDTNREVNYPAAP